MPESSNGQQVAVQEDAVRLSVSDSSGTPADTVPDGADRVPDGADRVPDGADRVPEGEGAVSGTHGRRARSRRRADAVRAGARAAAARRLSRRESVRARQASTDTESHDGVPPQGRVPADSSGGYTTSQDDPVEEVVTVPEEILREWQAALAMTATPESLLLGEDGAHAWLDLTHAHPSGLAQLMAGRPTRLSSLVREYGAYMRARHQVRAIRGAAVELASERGIRSGYLAAGIATWLPGPLRVLDLDASSGPVSAPVLLRGCTLVPRGAGHEDYDLVLDDMAVVNPELLRRLMLDYAVRPNGDALAELAFGRDGFDPHPVFARLESLCVEVPGFRVERCLVVGTFTAGSRALLADLEDAGPALVAHPLLGRLLRPPARRPGTGPTGTGPTGTGTAPPPPAGVHAAATLGVGDRDPAQDTLVLDLDPAQHAALDAVLAGQHLALEGPPGTGLTHTLTAVTAAVAARGRTVLVVTSRRATAEAFVARLGAVGLSDLVLDLQDGMGHPGRLLAGLAESVHAITAPEGPAWLEACEASSRRIDEAVCQTRSRLLASGTALHGLRAPWNVSAYEAMTQLVALMGRPRPPRTRVRLEMPVLARLDVLERERLCHELEQAATAGAFRLTRGDTRWVDAEVRTDEEAERVLAATRRARDLLGRARHEMDAVVSGAGLVAATTVRQWRPQLELLLGIREVLDRLLPEVFERSVDDLLDVTFPVEPESPSTPGGTQAVVGESSHGWMGRRRLRRRARSLVRPGVHVDDLHTLLLTVRRQRATWDSLSEGEGWPRVPEGLDDAGTSVNGVESALAVLAGVLRRDGRSDLLDLPLPDLEGLLADLATDVEGLRRQPRRVVLLEGLRRAGLGPLVTDLRERGAGPEDVEGELDLAWWTSVLEAIVREDPRLAPLHGTDVREAVDAFCHADLAHLADGAARVRAAWMRNCTRVAAEYPGELQWLRAEVAHAHRSVWPLDLLRRAWNLVSALRPVWVMSPDAVARLLEPAAPHQPLVDVVVVDDAGSVPLPEVVASLARGRQIVVAGDRRGVPPPGGGTSVMEAVASVLDVHRLDLDHRARDGRMLDAVRPCYPEGWVTTPGPEPSPPVRLELLPHGFGTPRPGDGVAVNSDAEVDRVVDLVSEHAAAHPGESLMVVTIEPILAERLEEALRSSASARPHLGDWLEAHWTGSDEAEPFVVRQADHVIGMERDHVIVSIGLARAETGDVPGGHDVLDEPAGAAALRVALTRARRRLTLVSCLAAGDLEGEGCTAEGVRVLRRAVEVMGAPWGGAPVPDGEPSVPPAPGAPAPALTVASPTAASPGHGSSGSGRAEGAHRSEGGDPLVADLRDRLRAMGLRVVEGFGDPDWPLDLVVQDPSHAGRMVVAVDLDGPAHASRRGVRERERQRRQRWERAGWAYHRVAAMDVFRDPDAEAEDIRRRWEETRTR